MIEFNRLLFKKQFAEYICLNWLKNKNVVHGVRYALKNTGIDILDFSNREHIDLIKDALGVKDVLYADKLDAFVSKNYPVLRDMLFDRRNYDECLKVAKKHLGLKPRKTAKYQELNIRERDTTRAWGTVK